MDMGDVIKVYSQEEEAANIIERKCLQKHQETRKETEKPSPFLPSESLKDLLQPEIKKSNFVQFREKLSENWFFQKPELGKALPLQTKPDTLTNENFTYGIKSSKSEVAYDLVLPKRSESVVEREYTNSHDKYLISHKHYFPSERIQRNYNENFNSNSTFGISNKGDTAGAMVRKCLQQSSPTLVNNTQDNFMKKTTSSKIDRAPINQDQQLFFNKRTIKDNRSVDALVGNTLLSAEKRALGDSISHVKKLRNNLFQRYDFHMDDLKILLEKYENPKGFITFSCMLKAMHSLWIRANEEKIRRAMSHFKIIENEGQPGERVHLDLFWKMLHIKYPLPIGDGDNVMDSEDFRKPDTTYRSFCNDRDKALSQSLHAVYGKTLKTQAGDCISPDVLMKFGLDQRDFEELRSKEDLRLIFKRVLSQNFDEIWNLARDKKGNNNSKMSINELIDVMDNK